MSMTLSLAASNPHIASLEEAFAQATRPIEWLIIAHNDPCILKSLLPALDGESAAVLELPQDLWKYESQQLSEMVEWALQQSNISHLVLVGSSASGSSHSRVSVVNGKSTNQALENYTKLLDGVQRSVARKRDAQSDFASQAQQMLQIPVLHSRWSIGELCFYPLFYRTDGGFFLAYDHQLDSFRPLLA